MLSGVPKGTVLSPILFLVHLNDILENVSSTVKLFADDCACYHVINNVNDGLDLQRDKDKLGNWHAAGECVISHPKAICFGFL